MQREKKLGKKKVKKTKKTTMSKRRTHSDPRGPMEKKEKKWEGLPYQ
jgi:hypothetical protein